MIIAILHLAKYNQISKKNQSLAIFDPGFKKSTHAMSKVKIKI